MKKDIKKIRLKMLKATFLAQEGHIASSLSVLDILFVLYQRILNINKRNFKSKKRNYLILSKGHASLAHAAILEHLKIISSKQLNSYCSFNSILGGHMSRIKVPAVEASTGSLGHGIGISVGLALSSKIQKKNNKVFVVVGDGEINEGTFWESLLLASNHKLNNLCCIIDYNRSNDRALKLDPLEQKLASFGFKVKIIDGHSHNEIFKQCSKLNNLIPTAIIANTIKGRGIKIMENNPEWHHKFPNQEEYISLVNEINLS